ncbi:MAG: hypothetical protein WCI73_10355, partial [Phycisphaerae bacterium]
PAAGGPEKGVENRARAGKTIGGANNDMGQGFGLAERAGEPRGGRKVIDAATSGLTEPQVLAEMSGGGGNRP